jgi:glucose dehydrogenase
MVALTSQAVSAALTVIGPGSPGAADWGAVLVQPARATAAVMALAALTTAADLRDM